MSGDGSAAAARVPGAAGIMHGLAGAGLTDTVLPQNRGGRAGSTYPHPPCRIGAVENGVGSVERCIQIGGYAVRRRRARSARQTGLECVDRGIRLHLAWIVVGTKAMGVAPAAGLDRSWRRLSARGGSCQWLPAGDH